MVTRRATREEIGEVGALLEASALPPLPTGTSLSCVLLGLEKGSVMGVVALEVVARRGLTLWVAVAREHQGRGLGKSLLQSLIARAHELSLREVYIVTKTASKFFAQLGFSPVSRAAVPSEIRSLRAYPDQCAESAEVMRLELETRI